MENWSKNFTLNKVSRQLAQLITSYYLCRSRRHTYTHISLIVHRFRSTWRARHTWDIASDKFAYVDSATSCSLYIYRREIVRWEKLKVIRIKSTERKQLLTLAPAHFDLKFNDALNSSRTGATRRPNIHTSRFKFNALLARRARDTSHPRRSNQIYVLIIIIIIIILCIYKKNIQ